MHQFKNPLEGALYLKEKGYKIFPIKPNLKEPAVNGWQEWAEQSTDKKILDFAKANPTSNWGVYAGPSNLAIIDVDNKPGKDGQRSIESLQLLNEPLPPTFTVKTPTGGLHYYFEGHIKSHVAFAKDIDTRGEGGYVVAPGSIINEEAYEIINEIKPAGLPHWIEKISQSKRQEPKVIEDDQYIEPGERNHFLASFAGGMRARGANHDVILTALLELNQQQINPPLPEEEVEIIARSIVKYPPTHAKAASDFIVPVHIAAKRASEIRPELIKPRAWVMQDRYIKGFVSVVISPGGVGKSTFTLLDAASIVSGEPLTGAKIIEPGPVWLYNLEDPMEELERQVLGMQAHHKLKGPILENLFISSGVDDPLIVAKADQSGVLINQGAIDQAADFIRKHGIKLLVADPVVRTHELNENDNMEMDKVAWAFQRIAIKGNCAVCLVHHTSKAGSSQAPGEMHSGRGATSLIYAARVAHTISVMSPAEARRFSIPEERRKWYVRIDNAKANLSPPALVANWFERKSVAIASGDKIGTMEKVPPFKDVTEVKLRERSQDQRDAMIEYLDERLAPGDSMAFTKLCELLPANNKYAGFFDELTGPTSVRNKLLRLFGGEVLTTEFKAFEFEDGAVKDAQGRKRPGKIIRCRDLKDEELPERDPEEMFQ